MTAKMMGALGDRILVNGRPDYTPAVATRAYRLRLLNGSNSRIYKLAWSNGRPMTVIATDGGLLAQPHAAPYVTLGPGERAEVWVDWRDAAVGSRIQLQSLAFSGVEAGPMAAEMEHASALPHGSAFDIMTFVVERAEDETLTLPATLATLPHWDVNEAVNAAAPRQIVLAMDAAMQWMLNGRVYAPGEIADDERIAFSALELWEFVNELPGNPPGAAAEATSHGNMHHDGMMGGAMAGVEDNSVRDLMVHPMHIHGAHFQVVERQVDPAYSEGWESRAAGFVDVGWKDTVLVMPGERLRLLIRFDGFPGVYVYHCHNLEHEDAGMMRNLLVQG